MDKRVRRQARRALEVTGLIGSLDHPIQATAVLRRRD
jgi:hypothetical protein